MALNLVKELGGMGPAVKVNLRDVEVREKGKVVFRQEGVEAPEDWSDQAVLQPARIYFRTIRGTKESSVVRMTDRVVGFVGESAVHPDVGTSLIREEDRLPLEAALKDLVLRQKMAWNTPVWVNAGADLPEGEKPQCSACFIQSVKDTMESITALQVSETMLFRRGSGTGTNLSTLRPKGSPLSRGGYASGPVSFMLGYDAWAGVTKSGGSSRRAAKMALLDDDHPDVMEFIESKLTAGKMIHSLVKDGWSAKYNDVATAWARHQNANHSLRVSAKFLEAVELDKEWELRFGADVRKVAALDVWKGVTYAAYETGCPGLQFKDQINFWHTCPSAGDINASNPCSEYLFIDDSACNLASLRATRHVIWDASAAGPRGTPGAWVLDVPDFHRTVRLTFLSQEAVVSGSGYPTEKIAENSRAFRPLGLGYADLGALIMRCGYSYDSPKGRGIAAALTSLLGAYAYMTSAEIARDCGGPFPAWKENRESMLRVIRMHLGKAADLHLKGNDPVADAVVPDSWFPVAAEAAAAWELALSLGEQHGFRNAQATLLAPTGTIGFMMDCDTTGVEPELGLVRYKSLAGGGTIRQASRGAEEALRSLGYADAAGVAGRLAESEKLPPDIKAADREVFACALSLGGWPVIRPEGHLLMVAAVQPYLSGAVSKTCNMPADSTEEDVSRIYKMAARHGLKAVALYRDGSKADQPVKLRAESPEASGAVPGPFRRELPPERASRTRKFELGGHDLYAHVGFHDDGTVGEVFFRAAKEGSLVSGLLDQLGIAVSLALQYGCPLEKVLEKMKGTRFDPAGFTGDPEFPTASSFLDAFASWAQKRFPEGRLQELRGELVIPMNGKWESPVSAYKGDLSGKLCRNECGLMVQDGTCWRCPACGDSTGGCGG